MITKASIDANSLVLNNLTVDYLKTVFPKSCFLLEQDEYYSQFVSHFNTLTNYIYMKQEYFNHNSYKSNVHQSIGLFNLYDNNVDNELYELIKKFHKIKNDSNFQQFRSIYNHNLLVYNKIINLILKDSDQSGICYYNSTNIEIKSLLFQNSNYHENWSIYVKRENNDLPFICVTGHLYCQAKPEYTEILNYLGLLNYFQYEILERCKDTPSPIFRRDPTANLAFKYCITSRCDDVRNANNLINGKLKSIMNEIYDHFLNICKQNNLTFSDRSFKIFVKKNWLLPNIDENMIMRKLANFRLGELKDA